MENNRRQNHIAIPQTLTKNLHTLIEKRVWLKILFALFAGIVLGIFLKHFQSSFSPLLFNSIINWIGFPGKLFIALIQMVVIPLVFVSVVKGVAATSKDMERLKKIGLMVGIYFTLTTAISIIIGLSTSKIIKYNHKANLQKETISLKKLPSDLSNGTIPIDTIPNKLIDLLPQNPLVAMSEGQMLQIVLFAMIVGFAILSIPSVQSKPLLILFASIQEVCMVVVRWAMYLAPIAVFGLLAETTAKTGLDTLTNMISYVSSVILGLLGVLFFYLILVQCIGKQNPLQFLRKIRQVQLLAFATSSSAAIMPLTMETAEKDLNVHPVTSQFIIPLGATINMDGTALYQGVATIFLADIAGIELGFGSLLLVIITAIGASIGSPGTPGVGMVILSGLLANIGIPNTGIALILGVDRILDMCRTVINVTGDLTASVVINRLIPFNKKSS